MPRGSRNSSFNTSPGWVDAYLSFDYDAQTPFSMATQKLVYFNEHLLHKVFAILELDPSFIKCNPNFDALRTYGAIALSTGG